MLTHKQKLELEAVFLIVVAVIVGLIVMAIRNGTFQPPFNIVSGASPVQVPVEVVAPKVTVSSQISPDGEKKVIMKVTENQDGTSTYDFSAVDEDGTNEVKIFTKTLALKTMSIPFNAWSPDDKYFFIQENAEENSTFYVFKANGELFSDTEQFFDGKEIFTNSNTGNNFDEATGWASETLIIINTKNKNNEKGPSYWLEIPSKAVIQLSTDF